MAKPGAGKQRKTQPPVQPAQALEDMVNKNGSLQGQLNAAIVCILYGSHSVQVAGRAVVVQELLPAIDQHVNATAIDQPVNTTAPDLHGGKRQHETNHMFLDSDTDTDGAPTLSEFLSATTSR